MKAGFCEKDITPPVGIWLAGFGSREKPCDGINDPLFLRIMVIEDGTGERAVVVTADLLKFPKALSWRVKSWCERQLMIKSSSVLINSSHTHCAPVLEPQPCYPHWPIDIHYVEALEQSIRDGIQTALRALRPVIIKHALHQAHFAINRRLPDQQGKVSEMRPHEEGYYDPDMPVFTFETPDQHKLLAILYSYACHPTAKGGYQVSADYPGGISRGLKKRLGQDVITFFAQGAGGNAKPRFYDKEKKVFAAATPEEVDNLGAQVAEGIAALRESDRMKEIRLSIKTREKEFHLPVDSGKIPSQEELLSMIDDPSAFFAQRIAGRVILEHLRSGSYDKSYVMHATKISLTPDIEIIGLSGEVTAEVGRMIKDLYPRKSIILLGYCSYTDAYIPNAKMIDEGGYEPERSGFYHGRIAPFTKGIDRIITKEVLSLQCGASPQPNLSACEKINVTRFASATDS